MDAGLRAALEKRYGGLASERGVNLSCGQVAEQLDVRRGEVCADLGCGRGRDVLGLARRVGPEGRVFGVDASEKMIAAAAEAARAAALLNVTLVRSSLEALALPDASVDWVVSNCALNHVADKARAWREIARVLKPGGRFAVSDIYAVEPISERYRSDPAAVAECWAGAEAKPEYLAHVTAAGLVEVNVQGEKAPYRKSEALLSSFTLTGRKPAIEEVMR